LALPLLLLFVISVVVLELILSWFPEKGSFCDVNVNVSWSHTCCVWLYKYLLGFSFVAPIIMYCPVSLLRVNCCFPQVRSDIY
jgi:hypothetical protein